MREATELGDCRRFKSGLKNFLLSPVKGFAVKTVITRIGWSVIKKALELIRDMRLGGLMGYPI